jgi:threonylcarbamoyladenosine tRNA methylthiotransferase MtaB
MSRGTAAFFTLGCKVNQYETEAIRQEVLDLGYQEVPFDEPADVYVVNTCAVTAQSGAKSRRSVLRACRRNPKARVIVVGCSTKSEKAKLAELPQVAFLAGNEEKTLVAAFLSGGWKPGDPFPSREQDLQGLRVRRYEGRTRATIKVQDGCDSFCSFCVIPFLRGRSRSRHPDAVEEEVRRLAGEGCLEVVLSGVHLQDYGLDLEPPSSLHELCARLAELPGLERLRLSSLGVRALSPEFLDLLVRPIFCRHWHIPLQSGAGEVLRLMRRGYTVEEFERRVEELRSRIDEPAITTDIIVGHPGETDAHFAETLEACRRLGFSKIHVFPFSLREGTLASKLWVEQRVHPLAVRERAAALSALGEELSLAYRSRFLGRTLEVLVEDSGGEDGGFLEGLADRYLRVRFPAPSERAKDRFAGTLQNVRAVGLGRGSHCLDGVWLEDVGDGAALPAAQSSVP